MSGAAQAWRRGLLRWGPAGFALAGLVLALVLIGRAGLADVLHALGTAGWRGFLLYCGLQLGLFVLLGAAWRVLMPARPAGDDPADGTAGGAEDAPGGGRAGLAAFVWGRMVRDTTGQFLPFSPVGGLVLGARTMTHHGLSWSLAAATTFADATTEMMAQIAFLLCGVLLLLRQSPHSDLLLPLAGGVVLALLAVVAFLILQRGVAWLFRYLGARVAGSWLDGATIRAERLQARLDAVYAARGRLAVASALHLAGWAGTALAAWVGFRLVGAPIGLAGAVVIEALLHAALSAGFVVPGAVGVQELAYVALAALFGVPADLALAVSLLRRGRDIVLGVPILVGWQWLEVRRR